MVRAITALLAGLALCLAASPAARAQSSGQTEEAQKKPKKAAPGAPAPPPAPLTIQYVATFSGSTVGRLTPALGHRLLITRNFPAGHSTALRVELYNNGSYHESPEGDLVHNINEPMFETQAYYTFPIHGQWSVTESLLHHDNLRIPDSYWWQISTLTYANNPKAPIAVSLNGSLEKRLAGGRFFWDLLGTASHLVSKQWSVAVTLHQYESLASHDPSPTHNQDYEIGMVRQLPAHHFLALTLFRHTMVHEPNDQFSYFRIKYGIPLK